MAVIDLWHRRDGQRCPECRLAKAGTPSSRHGRGLRWRVTVGDHPSRAFAVKADADAWEVHLRTRPAVGGATVAELVDLWLAGKRGLSAGGYEQCRRAADRVKAAWGPVSPQGLERAELQSWIAGLTVASKRRDAPPTAASHTVRSKALQCLAGAMRIARERGMVQVDPTADLRAGKATTRTPRFLGPTELAALAEASVWPAMIWLLGTGGYRATESLTLTVGNVDARRLRVRVERSKSGQGRDVPLMPPVLAMLDLDRPRHELLMVHPRGAVTDRRTLRNNVVAPAARRAGLGAVTTHDLRHTAASLAIAAGADVKMVQAMLGHASAAMTLDLYGHLWVGGLDDVARKMADMIWTDPLPEAP